MRISNVMLDSNKHVWIALCAVYGIGRPTSKSICKKLNIPAHTKVKDLPDDYGPKIQNLVDTLEVEGDLRRKVAMNIKRLRDIKCYRGIRHRRNLPVRGQRTRTNARTRKGKKKQSNKVAAQRTPAA